MVRDTSLRPTARRYNFADHGNSEVEDQGGRHMFKPGQVQHWSPAYGGGVTVVRFFPARSLEDPTVWDNYRFSSGVNQFGDWLRRYPAARRFGDPSVSFLMDDPADRRYPDPQMLPPWVLYNAIDRAVKRGEDQPGWAALLKGGYNRSPQLPKPSEVYFGQCAVLQHKTKPYMPPRGTGADEKVIVLEMSHQCGLAFLHELHQIREDYAGPEGDYEAQMLNGDPVGLSNGRFVTFYKLEDGDPRVVQQVSNAGWQQPANQGYQGQQQAQLKGYGVFLTKEFRGLTASLQQFEDMVASKVRPWDEIVHIPDAAEQAALLADKFPPEVIMYAFRDHPEWIPEQVARRAVAHRTVQAPGMPPTGPPPGTAPALGPGQVPTGATAWGAPPTGPPPGGAPMQAPPAGSWGSPPAGPAPAPAPAVQPGQQQHLPMADGTGPNAGPPPAAAPPAMAWGTEAGPAGTAGPVGQPAQAPPAAAGSWGGPPAGAAPAAPNGPVTDGAVPSQAMPAGAAGTAQPIQQQPAGGFAAPPQTNGGGQMSRAQMALAAAQRAAGQS